MKRDFGVGAVGAFFLVLGTVVLNLALLAGAVWVVVAVLKATGVIA